MYIERDKNGNINATYAVQQYKGQEKMTKKEQPAFEIKRLKSQIISKIKYEAYTRIINVYTEHEQLNIIANSVIIQQKDLKARGKSRKYTLNQPDLDAIKLSEDCKIFVDHIRQKSNDIELLIMNATTINEVQAIDFKNDSLWI